MTHTQPLGSTPLLIESSHWIKSSFHFSHDESLCFILLLIFFLIYHLIHHAVLKRNFLEFSSDSLMSNCLQISEMLLSCSGLPHVYKEAVLPQRKDNQVHVLFLAQLSSARSNFDYNIRICQQLSSRSQ